MIDRRALLALLAGVLLVTAAGCGAIGDWSTADPVEGNSTESDDPAGGDADDPSGGDGGASADENGGDGDDESGSDGSGLGDGEEAAVDEEDPEAETTEEADDLLPIDVYRTYDRTATLLESDEEMPDVEVWDMDELLSDTYESRQDAFQERLNMTETNVDTENARGLAYAEDRVVVDPNDAGVADVEQTLVHEYVHSIQYAEGWVPDTRGIDLETQTSTDFTQVHLALMEGGAVWVTDTYSETHQEDDVRLQSERLAHEYETAPDGDRFFRAPYHYGTSYVDERVDDPAEIQEVYANPPTTTEQLLHDLDPGEEEPTGLEVETNAEDWTVDERDRRGELFVRVVLETELPHDEAAEAAAGWGDDELVALSGDDERGYVWVLHWDSADDADGFESAFETVLDERTDEDADRTTVDRLDDRTVIVTVGSDAFREAVEVSGSDTDVEIASDGES